MATMQASNGQVLFTVEQIELLRRLRNSGITKDQIVLAFDSLDRLDRELGPVYTIPISQAFTQQLFARQVLAAAAVSVPGTGGQVGAAAQNTATPQQQQQQQALNVQQQAPVTPLKSAQVPSHTNGQSAKSDSASDTGSEKGDAQSTLPIDIKKEALNTQNGETAAAAALLANGSIPSDLILNPIEEIKDDNPEFVVFSSQGEPACCEQIRSFVSKYNIRQQQIATLSRISQSYVSRFLKGDFFDMSERSRRAIKKWFIAYKNNPAAIPMAVNLVLLSHGAQNGSSNGGSSNSSGQQQSPPKLTISAMDLSSPNNNVAAAEFLNQRRRERFVFRPNHLEILEKHFQEDSYPSFEKREDMARACNNATESLTGRPLGDKEVVTAQIVSNWFANKRKEMKKLAREEGLDLSQVPLRPRGRPCRFFGDLMSQLHDNGGSGRDADVEAAINGHLAEAQNLMQQEDTSTSCGEDEVVTVIPRAPEETAMEEQAAGTEQQQTPDERALSLSVELAAVNQAILSLTGQQPLGMKTTTVTANNGIKMDTTTVSSAMASLTTPVTLVASNAGN